MLSFLRVAWVAVSLHSNKAATETEVYVNSVCICGGDTCGYQFSQRYLALNYFWGFLVLPPSDCAPSPGEAPYAASLSVPVVCRPPPPPRSFPSVLFLTSPATCISFSAQLSSVLLLYPFVPRELFKTLSEIMPRLLH